MQGSGASGSDACVNPRREPLGEGRAYDHPVLAREDWEQQQIAQRRPRRFVRKSSEPSFSGTPSSSSLTTSSVSGAAGAPEVRSNLCFREYEFGKCESGGCTREHNLTNAEREALAARASTPRERYIYSTSSDELTPATPTLGVEPVAPPLQEPDLRARLRAAQTMSMDEVRNIVPKDENGNPTSIGSILHPSRCKPCRGHTFARCRLAFKCRFCHFADGHERRKLTLKEKKKFKKWKEFVEKEILKDPGGFDLAALVPHDALRGNDVLRDSTMAYFANFQREALANNGDSQQ